MAFRSGNKKSFRSGTRCGNVGTLGVVICNHWTRGFALILIISYALCILCCTLWQGFTNVPLALTLMLTSVPGAAIGAQLAQRVSGPLLKRITASVMLCAAPVLWMSAEKKAKSLPHPAAASKDSAEVFDPQASQLEQSLKALRERNQIQWRAFTHNPALAVADAVMQIQKQTI